MSNKLITIPERLLPDPSKLELLADYLDLLDRAANKVGNDESQRDLREWASNLREFGVDGRYVRKQS